MPVTSIKAAEAVAAAAEEDSRAFLAEGQDGKSDRQKGWNHFHSRLFRISGKNYTQKTFMLRQCERTVCFFSHIRRIEPPKA